MKRRRLGSDGLEVSAIGLGCMGMSEYYGATVEEESVAAVHRALELGITLFDTADEYGVGDNERLLGQALRGHRNVAIIASKFGIVRKQDDREFLELNGRPEYAKEACDASLQRLGVDSIDLYYLHRVDPEVPIEDSVGAMSELVEAGKVRFLGLSEVDANSLRRAHRVHPIAALQSEYSLWNRFPEDDVLPTVRELGIGFVPYSPLGRGFLTGRFKRPEDLPEEDWRRRIPRFQGENFYRNLELVDAVRLLADEKGITPAQLAIAWTMSQGENMVPIPGTKRRKYVEENARAVEVELTPAELERLDAIVPAGAAAGERDFTSTS